MSDEGWKEYAVTLWAEEGHKSWMYIQRAQDPKTAWIQARLRHAGKGLPEIRKTFSFDNVKEV